MNYSLSQSLSRSGAINPDGLSLDLAFAADKTLTARKGTTPTFTRASTATFVGSDGLIQSAAINEARFDHDPVTLACKGLLIEEARTNALQHSSNFKNTTSSNYWQNLSATTVTVDQIASPDGGLNADLLATSTASFDCFTRRVGIFAGSTQYTYSIFLKQGPSGYRYVGLYIGVGINSTKFPFFDFNNPTTVQIPSGTMVGTIDSTRVDAYPDGWYRVSVAFTTAATPHAFCGVYISQSDGNLPGSSVAGLDAYIWGIQLEAGSFPTSYIPTTTAALTRSADVCSITGGDFTSFYNQSEGTLLMKATSLMDTATPSNRGFLGISAGSYSNQISITKSTGASTLQLRIASNPASTSGSIIQNTEFKIAAGLRGSDTVTSFNGGSVITVTAPTLPSVDRILFRDPTSAGAGHPTYYLASFRYYKKRLANAKLQALTQLVSDADANAYITSLLSVGAVVTLTQQDAINTFVKAGKADGWWSSLKRLYLPIWASAAPNAVDMITRASGTFNGTVTHAAGYVQGNGSTGYFNIGANQSTMGIGSNDTHIGFLSLVGPSASTCVHIGVQSPTTAETYQIASISGITLSSVCGNQGLSTGLAAANQNGVISSSKISGGFVLFKRNTAGGSVLSSSLANNANSISNSNFYTMARNSVGTANFFSTAQYGSWFFGNGLNQSGVTDFTLALKNLWETCTGLTLP
jgi:hypothetical protein